MILIDAQTKENQRWYDNSFQLKAIEIAGKKSKEVTASKFDTLATLNTLIECLRHLNTG